MRHDAASGVARMTAFGSAALFTHALFGSTRAIPALSSERLVGAKAVNRQVTSECLQLGGFRTFPNVHASIA